MHSNIPRNGRWKIQPTGGGLSIGIRADMIECCLRNPQPTTMLAFIQGNIRHRNALHYRFAAWARKLRPFGRQFLGNRPAMRTEFGACKHQPETFWANFGL